LQSCPRFLDSSPQLRFLLRPQQLPARDLPEVRTHEVGFLARAGLRGSLLRFRLRRPLGFARFLLLAFLQVLLVAVFEVLVLLVVASLPSLAARLARLALKPDLVVGFHGLRIVFLEEPAADARSVPGRPFSARRQEGRRVGGGGGRRHAQGQAHVNQGHETPLAAAGAPVEQGHLVRGVVPIDQRRAVPGRTH